MILPWFYPFNPAIHYSFQYLLLNCAFPSVSFPTLTSFLPYILPSSLLPFLPSILCHHPGNWPSPTFPREQVFPAAILVLGRAETSFPPRLDFLFSPVVDENLMFSLTPFSSCFDSFSSGNWRILNGYQGSKIFHYTRSLWYLYAPVTREFGSSTATLEN